MWDVSCSLLSVLCNITLSQMFMIYMHPQINLMSELVDK